ncbi:MAG: glycerophosphodiester phosphodiesterase [Gallionella sp.]|nr:glycerophosphodiester phosphodiesterase [Gallionella sp.]
MKRTLVFAHRGANREAAENTRSAFDRALAYPVDGIETDIQLSRDGVAVLWHDRFLGKLGLPGKRIDDFDYAELQAMDFAAHFAHAEKSEGVMSLREFLAAYRMRCCLLLEIKNRAWEQPARHEAKVRQTLELAGTADDRILVSSFDLSSLVYAHRCAPQFPLVLNLEPEHGADFARSVLATQPFLHGLCVHIGTLDEAMISALRECGKRIAVYTCNSDEEINRALALGVDILISDVPQKALQIRAMMVGEK